MEKKSYKKRYRSAPLAFGTSTPRFIGIGFHPALDPSGCMKKTSRGGGPGQYDIGFVKCNLKDAGGSQWARMVELEEFSRFLGFRNAPILEDREFQRAHRGPGTYNISYDWDKIKSFCVNQNKDFTTEKRFNRTIKYDSPPANSYFRNMGTKFDTRKKTFGTKPHLEWSGLTARFKDEEPNYRKPPNLYNVPDPGSFEALMGRVVSTKRPFLLFSGKRDGSSIKNHFAPPQDDTPDKFHIEPSDIDNLLHHPGKRRCGKFLQDERFPKRPTARMQLSDLTMCYKDPSHPGPGHYDLSNEMSIKPADPEMYAFGSSNVYQRPPMKWVIHPAPGRYFIKEPTCDKRDRPSCVFLNKPGRVCYIKPEEYTELYT